MTSFAPHPDDDLTSVATDVLTDISTSPTPYHAVDRSVGLLDAAGFRRAELGDSFDTSPGGYYAVQGGSLMAWYQQPTHRGFAVVGAHTDSPNLRVRTNPDVKSAGLAQIGMEIYGGVLLNSWLDRGLGLAGRISVTNGEGQIEQRLFLDDRPLMTIPQLAIHLDREVVSSGLKLDSQKHLIPMWASAPDVAKGSAGDQSSDAEADTLGLKSHVANLIDIEPEQILAWDLMAFDVQPPAVIGRDRDLFSTARIDNLLSTFCGLRALLDLAADSPTELARTPVLALYDHEEIGSESSTGAAGALLASLLERIAGAEGAPRSEFLAGLNRSIVISADGAHATHPNYPDRHEPSHPIALNGGVVVKRNANQRYATDAMSEAFIVDVCRQADVPLQYYIHRNDLPCGSTIGPITAARLGVSTVDLGAPQLAMHSARETAGIHDLSHLHSVLLAAWRSG